MTVIGQGTGRGTDTGGRRSESHQESPAAGALRRRAWVRGVVLFVTCVTHCPHMSALAETLEGAAPLLSSWPLTDVRTEHKGSLSFEIQTGAGDVVLVLALAVCLCIT